MAGGAPFHITWTHALDFADAPSFAPLFLAKGEGLDASPSANTAKYNHLCRLPS